MGKIQRITAVYFSPTGGTKKTVLTLAEYLGRVLGLPCEEIDFTLPPEREKQYKFSPGDLVVIGSPVYAGRVPNKIMPDFKKCFSGEETAAVPVVVYGNRSYGGALTELCMILQESGFRVIGAAAVVSRHAFSKTLAQGRPDEQDVAEIFEFADRLAENFLTGSEETDESFDKDDRSGTDESRMVNLNVSKLDLRIKDAEIEPYYTPLKEDGTPAKFLKAKPQTDFAICDHCGLCVNVCPMGSIEENLDVPGICIKCQACVRICPQQAKYFDDVQFLSHVRMLERNYTRRAENYFFIS